MTDREKRLEAALREIARKPRVLDATTLAGHELNDAVAIASEALSTPPQEQAPVEPTHVIGFDPAIGPDGTTVAILDADGNVAQTIPARREGNMVVFDQDAVHPPVAAGEPPEDAIVDGLMREAQAGMETRPMLVEAGEPPRDMMQIDDFIAKCQDIRARYGNTCVYTHGVWWGACALNQRDEDEAAEPPPSPELLREAVEALPRLGKWEVRDVIAKCDDGYQQCGRCPALGCCDNTAEHALNRALTSGGEGQKS